MFSESNTDSMQMDEKSVKKHQDFLAEESKLFQPFSVNNDNISDREP